MNTNQQPGTAGTQQTTNGEFGESQYGPRLVYTESHWRDPISAIVWIVHMLVMAYALYGVWGSGDVDDTEANDAFLIVFVTAVIGAVFGVAWMQILRQCAGTIIKFMLLAYLAMMIVGTISMFAAGALLYGILMAVFCLIFGLYIRAVWPRIPFTAVLIDISAKIMQTYSGTIWVSILCLGLQIVWVLWWAAVASGYFSYSNPQAYVIFLLLVSFYWSLQVFQNISHMTTCGVAGAWYFSSGYSGGLTMSSLKRTLTTSFGSVCLGSFIVAIIQAARAMVRMARNSGEGGVAGAILLCIADCMLRCLDSLVRFFNKYAYVQCALYGTSFRESASRTWDLMMSRGIDIWINDDLTGFALFCGSLVGGIICAIVSYFMASETNSLSDGSLPYLMAFVGFIVGYFLVHTVLYTIDSGVAAMFVCYSEDPDAMVRNRPEQYNKLIAVAPPMHDV